MSPHIMVDLNELHATLKRLNLAYRNKRFNERELVSRNKREGWYFVKLKGKLVSSKRKFVRTRTKDNAIRYRKASGMQFFRPTLRYKSKARVEAEMAAIGARMVSK